MFSKTHRYVAEQQQRLVQLCIQLFLCLAFVAGTQFCIDEFGDQLGWFVLSLVNEVLECFLCACFCVWGGVCVGQCECL